MKGKYIVVTIASAIAGLGLLWWAIFGLTPYTISDESIAQRYVHTAATTFTMEKKFIGDNSYDIRYRSFDGAEVHGRIVYPPTYTGGNQPLPVLIGMHGLGRTHLRWWQSELRGRPTIENTHHVTQRALALGYAVIAIDARRHGAREPGFAASSLLVDLKLWGKRTPYETMIVDTVRDYRLLIDWIAQQPELNKNRIKVAGYSMGAQTALLLTAHDARVSAVAAIVPPHLDNKVALVSPMRHANKLANKAILLITGDDDEYASSEQSLDLYTAIQSDHKRHIRFNSGHALPAEYVEQIAAWLMPHDTNLHVAPSQ